MNKRGNHEVPSLTEEVFTVNNYLWRKESLCLGVKGVTGRLLAPQWMVSYLCSCDFKFDY